MMFDPPTLQAWNNSNLARYVLIVDVERCPERAAEMLSRAGEGSESEIAAQTTERNGGAAAAAQCSSLAWSARVAVALAQPSR